MRAFAAVFAREVVERRTVFLVGICSGCVFIVAAALHGWNAPGSAEVRLLAGSVGGVALGTSLALLYGASVIAGETAEKRISFYFSRPILASAICAGKLLAAIFVSFSAGLLVFLPGWLTGPKQAQSLWGFNLTLDLSILLGLALVTTGVLVAHALVTVARLRSPWALLDLTFAIGLTIVATSLFSSFALRMIAEVIWTGADSNPLTVAGWILKAGLAVALVFAALSQVAFGRTDARRAHGAFSLALWSVLSGAVVILAGYVWWCSSARAGDLTSVGGFTAAPRGPWIGVAGPLRALKGGGSFFFDAASGQSIRIYGFDPAFSRDGTRAAWRETWETLVWNSSGAPRDLRIADLSTGRIVETGLEASGWVSPAISPSGRRLAIRDEKTLAAYDVSDPANPKQLAVFPLEEDGRAFAFVDEDTIRLFPRSYNAANRKDIAPPALEVVELSLPSKRSLVTGRFNRETVPFLRLSADGRYFVGTRRLTDDPYGKQALTLHDGPTGALIATLAEGLTSPQLRFLRENRIAVAGINGAQARLLFFEGEKGWGAPSLSFELGKAKRVVLGGEIAPGRVALSLLPFKENLPTSPRAAKLVIVDAATGAVSGGPDGLVPADRFGWWFNPVLPPAVAGSPASRLFLDADGRLVRLDPTTFGETVLLGKGK